MSSKTDSHRSRSLLQSVKTLGPLGSWTILLALHTSTWSNLEQSDVSPHAFTSNVHVFICSRIDYCNSLLVHLQNQKVCLSPLQPVLNAAARLIARLLHLCLRVWPPSLAPSHCSDSTRGSHIDLPLAYWASSQVFTWPYLLAFLCHLSSYTMLTWPSWSLCPTSEEFYGSDTSLCNHWPYTLKPPYFNTLLLINLWAKCFFFVLSRQLSSHSKAFKWCNINVQMHTNYKYYEHIIHTHRSNKKHMNKSKQAFKLFSSTWLMPKAQKYKLALIIYPLIETVLNNIFKHCFSAD